MEHRSAAVPAQSTASTRVAGARSKGESLSLRSSFGNAGPSVEVAWGELFGGSEPSVRECEALDAIARARPVGAGQVVFNHLSPACDVVVLLEGEVALGIRTADGTFRTERIVRGLGWLDIGSAWLDETYAIDARASSPSMVVDLPRAELAAALRQYPGLASHFIRALAREVQALAENTHELMHKDAPARLAHWLALRCQPVEGQEGKAVVQLHERKRDVASQLAITPETLSRLMRSFARQGVIEVAGYTVRVLDTQALGQLAKV